MLHPPPPFPAPPLTRLLSLALPVTFALSRPGIFEHQDKACTGPYTLGPQSRHGPLDVTVISIFTAATTFSQCEPHLHREGLRVSFTLRPFYTPLEGSFTWPEQEKGHRKRINISWNRGTMNVRNLSIPIYCDGFYLVSLKGTIKAMSQRNASLSLKVYKRSDASILCVKVTEQVIDSVTVSEMRFKDEVYLEANGDANYKDLTLGLFLLTPRSDCLPDAYKM
uniref:Uncharacterized protein n=1 Tax=Chelonoidis abingdonii TaxID=106734 RepID=A0A8C0J658_CHEAB